MTIINLTQHIATSEQKEQRVVESTWKHEIQELLTFTGMPTPQEIEQRAEDISRYALCFDQAMIGGAPYLMAPLERALRNKGVKPIYAYSERVSEEQTQPDGTVRKVNIFKHIGFIPAV